MDEGKVRKEGKKMKLNVGKGREVKEKREKREKV